MAKKRDFLDDIIDIQNDWQAVQNPLGNLASALGAEPGEVKTWNPADYKERPRVNVTACITCTSKKDACSACVDVCPVGAVSIEDGGVELSDACRKCGLCLPACPTEAFVSQQLGPRKLYDRIVSAAISHEEAYVTCTRALGRLPKDNEICLPCVGVVPAEVWFAVIADYPNVSVYLPLGICDRCKTATGEEAYVNAIGQAEEWAEQHVGLEVDEGELDHDKRREWERKEFLNNLAKSGAAVAGSVNPALNAVQLAASRVQEHSKQITHLERQLEEACGISTSEHKHRMLIQRRQLVLSTLQKHPELVEHIDYSVPACDTTLCTMCADCVHACPVHAIDIDKQGRFSVEPAYCVGCGVCVLECATGALRMVDGDKELLLVPDEDSAKAEAAAKKQKEEVERLKREGKKRFDQGLEMLDRVTGGATAPDKKPAAKKPAAKKSAAKKPAAKATPKKPAAKKAPAKPKAAARKASSK